jgi:RNA recognition motif-containing protein
MKLYVGTSPPRLPKADLRARFEQFGTIAGINVIKDRTTGYPRGFTFVRMSNVGEGRAAISGLQGEQVRGRMLVVNEARAGGFILRARTLDGR